MINNKVLLVNFFPFLNSSGGAEKVCCNMANALQERGWEVKIVCNDDQPGKAFYPLDEKIEVINLACKNNLKIPRQLKLKRELGKIFQKNKRLNCCDEYKYNFWAKNLQTIVQAQNPYLIICFDMEAAHAVDRIASKQVKKIFMLHMNSSGFKEYLLEDERHIKVLNAFDAIQVLFPSHKTELEAIIRTKFAVIPNVVPNYVIESSGVERQAVIMNLARICQEKGQDILIEAFAMIAHKYPQWQLKLYGKVVNAKYFKSLQVLVARTGLKNKIFFAGVTEQAEVELKKVKIFVFPSINEGFPLALTEAMSAGLPCIGFESCAGVKDLLIDGQTGLLVKRDVRELAKAMERLIVDSNLAQKLALAGKQSLEQYSAAYIWDSWDKLIRGL